MRALFIAALFAAGAAGANPLAALSQLPPHGTAMEFRFLDGQRQADESDYATVFTNVGTAISYFDGGAMLNGANALWGATNVAHLSAASTAGKGGYTFHSWIFLTNMPTGNRHIYFYGGPVGADHNYSIDQVGLFWARLHRGDVYNAQVGHRFPKTDIATNRWQLISVAWNGILPMATTAQVQSNMFLWLNGVPKNNDPIVQSGGITTLDYRTDSQPWLGGPPTWNGGIGRTILINGHCATTEEVVDYYNRGPF
jgi:hypothetical protein